MNRRSTRGFTLVELTTAIAIFAIMILMFFSFVYPMIFSSRINSLQAEMAQNAQFALDEMATSSQYVSAFLPEPDGSFSDSYAPSSKWNYRGDDAEHRVLITRNYETNTNLLNSKARQIYRRHISSDCWNSVGEVWETFNPVFSNNTIYFVKDGTLYRRWLTIDTSGSRCGNQPSPYLHQTCPGNCSSVTPPVSAPHYRAYDSVLAHNVESFTVEYFAAGGVPIDNIYDSATRDKLVNGAIYAKVTLKITNTYGTRSASYTTSTIIDRIQPHA
ncbi:hypothetical protein CR983_00670 [Candidatus Saccharibacteria bacterium]|nr:MAG: hypothetical protein CR983_00670 [Candidatus Saccharibacteria bacterium]